MGAGLDDCSASCKLRCGSGTQPRSEPSECASRRRIGKMRSLILRLLLEDRFRQIWVPSWGNRDMRQLLWHRHRMVQARMRIMNQLQAVALNEGLRCKKGLWREAGRKQLESFALAPWASRRRAYLWPPAETLFTPALRRHPDKSPPQRAGERLSGPVVGQGRTLTKYHAADSRYAAGHPEPFG